MATKKQVENSPIGRLCALLAEAKWPRSKGSGQYVRFDPEYLSYCLGKGVITPAYLQKLSGSTQVFELAEEIREDTWSHYKHREEK